MCNFKKHLILKGSSVKLALETIDNLPNEGILFTVDSDNKLIGSISDGDIRRAFLTKKILVESRIDSIMNTTPKFIRENNIDVIKIKKLREDNLKLVPIVDDQRRVVEIINFKRQKTLLPIDVIIMAGGLGKRLRPLTYKTPKPLLKVNDKTLIEHGLNHISIFGVRNYWISLGYLGFKIKDYLSKLNLESINFNFIFEDKPLGTLGAISNVKNFENESILITNADLISDYDLEKFYLSHIEKNSDLTILTRNYEVKIPFGVIGLSNDKIIDIEEKPKLKYMINGGIYLMKKKYMDLVPKNKYFNATDLIKVMIEKKFKINYYNHFGTWNDLGRIEDFDKQKLKLENKK